MEEFELFEKYYFNSLSEQERLLFEDIMRSDAALRERAENHFVFLKSLQDYGDRKSLKESLNKIHEEIHSSEAGQKIRVIRIKKYWSTLAMAASIALVCTLGTYLALRWNSHEDRANYLELRKNVETLKKSHNQILENIKEKNKKPEVAPGKYSGTGFLISPNGYVATSYHVIKSADSIFIENEKFGRLKVALVYGNPSTDIALLFITDTLFTKLSYLPFAIRAQEGNLGESVYTLGYPRNEIVYGDGSISAASGFEQNENSYQISIPVNPGNSGGPMIDQQGAVIGIINGVQTETRGTAFAVKSGVLLDELKSIPRDSLAAPIKLNAGNPLVGMSRVNQIKRLKDFVFIVKVYHGK